MHNNLWQTNGHCQDHLKVHSKSKMHALIVELTFYNSDFLAKYECFVLAGQNIMVLAYYYMYHGHKKQLKIIKNCEHRAHYQVFNWI